MNNRAERAIRIALKLDPTNRFVLRSAARFYIHQGSAEIAHQLLANADSTGNDPWLVAAEIAVASAGNQPPQFVRQGAGMLSDDSIAPMQLTELASAVATLELESGKHGAARKLFRKALIAPTENSVAQAEWASTHVRGLTVDPDRFKVPRLFEARAWGSFTKGEWSGALLDSENWLLDQPFSSRPAMLGSYVALVVFEDHKRARMILERGLIANPSDPILLNNLAFSCASQGLVRDAEKALGQIDDGNLDGESRVVVTATHGLVSFRKGLVEQGRAQYLKAINEATRLGLMTSRAMAAIYLAREEGLARSPNSAEAFRRALKESKISPTDSVLLLLERLREGLASNYQSAP